MKVLAYPIVRLWEAFRSWRTLARQQALEEDAGGTCDRESQERRRVELLVSSELTVVTHWSLIAHTPPTPRHRTSDLSRNSCVAPFERFRCLGAVTRTVDARGQKGRCRSTFAQAGLVADAPSPAADRRAVGTCQSCCRPANSSVARIGT